MKDNTLPLVSIIIPVYNTPRLLLQRCLNSVNSCYDSRVEIIVVDDGSEHDCAVWLDTIATQCINTVLVLHQHNQGQTSARNNGVSHAHGQYIAFVDSDDYIDFYKFIKLLDYAIQHDVDIIHYGSINEVANTCNITSQDTEGDIVYTLTHGSQMINTAASLAYALYNRLLYIRYAQHAPRQIRIGEDLAISAVLCMAARTQVYADSIIYHYCNRSGSITRSARAQRSGDSYIALQYVIQQAHHIATFDAYQQEIEWLAIRHIWYFGVSAVIQAYGPYSKQIKERIDEVAILFPNWQDNIYLQHALSNIASNYKYWLLFKKHYTLYWILYKLSAMFMMKNRPAQ